MRHHPGYVARLFLTIVFATAGLCAPIALGATPAAADDATTCVNAKGDEAIDACTRAIASAALTNVARSKFYDWRGFHFDRDKGDYARAIADYDEAIRLDAKNAAVHNNRGLAYARKGDYDREIMDLNRAIALDPKYSLAYANRGIAYNEKGDYDRAITDLNQAITLNAKYATAYANRGFAYNQKGDSDRAIADLSQALLLDPTYMAAYSSRGFAYNRKGDFDRALQDFDGAIRLDPKYAHAWGGRAIAREGKGDINGAYRDLAAALAADPSAASASGVQAMRERLSAALARDNKGATPIAPAPDAVSPPAAPSNPGPPAPTPAEKRVALVIGNSAYNAVAALPNPRRDADAVAAALRSVGFQTVRLESDIGRDRMVDILRSFAHEADNADWALVYYAGHGIEMGGVNYLVPVDAKLEVDRDVEYEAIPLEHVMSAVDGAHKLRLVLLDACRDNPFAAQMRRTLASRSVARGLASVEPATGTLVVYAAKDGETALDGDGANSPFAAALVRELQVPGLEVRRMFDFVRDDVMQSTSNRQQPFSYGSVSGRQDFYFVAATPRPAATTRADIVRLFDRFRLVLARVQSDYVENTDARQLLQAAIASMQAAFPAAQKVASASPPQLLPVNALPPSAKTADAGKPDLNDLYDTAEQILGGTRSRGEDVRLVDAAIDGLLGALDSHSSYMSAQSFRDVQTQTSGEFGGLGLEVNMNQGLPRVVAAIDDTPAARAGIRTNDVISHIDGAPTLGLPLNRVLARMRGPVGSTARLTIVRAGEDAPLDLSMTREVIRTRPVRWRVDGEDVGYIRITQFNQLTGEGIKKAVADIAAQLPDSRLKGYVLDLRNDPGGLLDQVVAVADEFLEQGDIVSTRGRRPEQRFAAKPGDLTNGKPMIVLINGGTASGSEIVAGALHDNKRAQTVGTRSFGNGSVQTIFPLGAGQGALRLTTSRFFTPSGSAIQAVGIVPDIEVVQDVPDEARATSESKGEWFMQRHLPGEGRPYSLQSYVPPDSAKDKALQKALELLRTAAR